MTTNLQAVSGGPSRLAQNIEPKMEPVSPIAAVQQQDLEVQEEPSGGVSKPGLSVDENGQVVKVPAFLNKLFSMVSDPETDELIYWADSGDSFFVPNHERFGKELLPRFFKHANFSSFVRQLNMYGFHKVPHLQSGVLKNEAPSELWEFVNPFFKRDQRQLLARVTRKNNRPAQPTPPATGSTGPRSSARQAAANAQSSTSGYNGMHLLTDGTTEGEAGPLVGPSGQLADLRAIQNGINAIRQTQAAIGADLKALQASNEHLWREALESRERAQKHEETIDLIVSFLERLFGTEGEGLKGLKEAMRRGGLSRNRSNDAAGEEEQGSKKRRRLLIEDGRSDSDVGRLVEIQEPSSVSSSATIEPYVTTASSSSADLWNPSGPRFTSVPTDEGSPRSFTGNALKPTPGADQTLHQSAISPISDGVPETSGTNQPSSSVTPYGANGDMSQTGLTDTMIDQLIRSPAAAEMLLNTLNASSQSQALTNVGSTGTSAGPGASADAGTTADGKQQMTDPTMQLFSPLMNHQALLNNANDLLDAYHRADGVNSYVNQMQENVDAFVRGIGLIPHHPDGGVGAGSEAGPPVPGSNGTGAAGAVGDVGNAGDAGTAPPTASASTAGGAAEPEGVALPDGGFDTDYDFFFEPNFQGNGVEEGL